MDLKKKTKKNIVICIMQSNTLHQNRLLAAFFGLLAAFLSATNSICGALESAARNAAKENAAKISGVFCEKMPLKVKTFSGAFQKNAAKGMGF